jgi:hypothetical protein
MDLRPYMNPAPYCVSQHATVPRCYRLFTTLGLRSICVVNHFNEVVGMITRKVGDDCRLPTPGSASFKAEGGYLAHGLARLATKLSSSLTAFPISLSPSSTTNWLLRCASPQDLLITHMNKCMKNTDSSALLHSVEMSVFKNE